MSRIFHEPTRMAHELTKRRGAIVFMLCTSLVFLIGNTALAQLLSSTTRADSAETGNLIDFGFSKVASTFLFHGDANAVLQNNDFFLAIRQQYRGSTIRTASSTFRDDESLGLLFRSFSGNHIQPLAQSDVQVSRDSRAIGLSSLTRYNLGLGARLLMDSLQWIEAEVGAESNKLLGIQDRGSLWRLNAQANRLEMDQFLVDSKLRSEFSVFSRRTNGDVDAAVEIHRDFDAQNALHLRVGYRTFNRDWYSQIANDTATATVIESRLEKRLALDAAVLFSITNTMNASVQLGLSDGTISRGFKDVLETVATTGVRRDLSEIQFNLAATIQWRLKHSRYELGIVSASRDEQNTASRTSSDLAPAQLDTLQQQERVRDNTMGRHQLSLSAYMQLFTRDSLIINGSASILHYDTPSNANDDDRDELNDQLALRWVHRFHESFSADITARTQLSHLVYLKADRSALNSWNRIIQCSPGLQWDAGFISMHPSFEVLAQYTVYDFSGKAGVPASFSFRQVAWRDSIVVPMNAHVRAEVTVYVRHFERGELYWSSFAELTQSKNYEQFVNLLFNFQPVPGVSLSGGGRWYALSQENVEQNSANNSLGTSIGPECRWSVVVAKSTRLNFIGWYELQFANHVHVRNVPNLTFSLQRSF